MKAGENKQLKHAKLMLSEDYQNNMPGKAEVIKELQQSNILDNLRFLDDTDENNNAWTNDEVTMTFAIKKDLPAEERLRTALKLAEFAVNTGADEFNFYTTQGTRLIRIWWD
jgi:hypothetical protein